MRGFSIDLDKAVKVKNGELPTNTVLGGAKDGHGQFYAIFCRTDKESGALQFTDKGRMLFNVRASKPKSQMAQTPGQALTGVSPDAIAAAVAQVLAAANPAPVKDEADFSDLNTPEL